MTTGKTIALTRWTLVYYSAIKKNTFESVLMTWINLEPIIQSETSQKEKDHCLLRKLYAGQEATVRNGHGTTDWFQREKEVHQGCILSPSYLTSMQSTS